MRTVGEEESFFFSSSRLLALCHRHEVITLRCCPTFLRCVVVLLDILSFTNPSSLNLSWQAYNSRALQHFRCTSVIRTMRSTILLLLSSISSILTVSIATATDIKSGEAPKHLRPVLERRQSFEQGEPMNSKGNGAPISGKPSPLPS